MLSIDSITHGVVLDHIAAGRGMSIFHLLKLDEVDSTVAIIKNVKSGRLGRKDMIKIEDRFDLDLDALGYIDANITVNIIEDGQIKKKHNLSLPSRLTNVIICKNPRCITSAEQGLEHEFVLFDKENKIYRCLYCEQENG
ncbi:MAG: aspartate carbamoyltransferase regulatory subunit [Defluviitaleaceae bacterium]|nr:aspartate carbamoyltransferase regulatory subunit [Defluviitaleaceae bacterium]